MTREKEIYIFEEDGFFFLTDQYDLIRIQFPTAIARQTWLDGYEAATGKRPVVIEGKPDIAANLARTYKPLV